MADNQEIWIKILVIDREKETKLIRKTVDKKQPE